MTEERRKAVNLHTLRLTRNEAIRYVKATKKKMAVMAPGGNGIASVDVHRTALLGMIENLPSYMFKFEEGLAGLILTDIYLKNNEPFI